MLDSFVKEVQWRNVRNTIARRLLYVKKAKPGVRHVSQYGVRRKWDEGERQSSLLLRPKFFYRGLGEHGVVAAQSTWHSRLFAPAVDALFGPNDRKSNSFRILLERRPSSLPAPFSLESILPPWQDQHLVPAKFTQCPQRGCNNSNHSPVWNVRLLYGKSRNSLHGTKNPVIEILSRIILLHYLALAGSSSLLATIAILYDSL